MNNSANRPIDDDYSFSDEDMLGVHWPGPGRLVPDWAAPDGFPRMDNISAGFTMNRVIRPEVPERTEVVTVPYRAGRTRDERLALQLAIARWNTPWEAAQFRRRFLDPERMPPQIQTIAERGDVNVTLVPRTPSRYFEYSPLFHLLPRRTLERHRLPLIKMGLWPFLINDGIDRLLPTDLSGRLASAWSDVVWRDLVSGSAQSKFSSSDPIRILAHNLDYWLPFAINVIEDELRTYPLGDGEDGSPVPLADGSFLAGAIGGPPRKGGPAWYGEADAEHMLERVIDEADRSGALRGLVDAIKSNRVEDDFSERWSFAKEDFERKLYRKRGKIRVSFVELPDNIPIQGPEAEVVGNLVTAGFLAMLDEKQRRIVVLLRSGVTKLGDVGTELGYANHSAVSKHLTKIRTQATQFFSEI